LSQRRDGLEKRDIVSRPAWMHHDQPVEGLY
jgi:hypothetical protein